MLRIMMNRCAHIPLTMSSDAFGDSGWCMAEGGITTPKTFSIS